MHHLALRYKNIERWTLFQNNTAASLFRGAYAFPIHVLLYLKITNWDIKMGRSLENKKEKISLEKWKVQNLNIGSHEAAKNEPCDHHISLPQFK